MKVGKEGLGFTDVLDIPDELKEYFKIGFLKVSGESKLWIETKEGLVLSTKLSNIINLSDGDYITSLAVKPELEG